MKAGHLRIFGVALLLAGCVSMAASVLFLTACGGLLCYGCPVSCTRH